MQLELCFAMTKIKVSIIVFFLFEPFTLYNRETIFFGGCVTVCSHRNLKSGDSFSTLQVFSSLLPSAGATENKQ